MSLFMTMSKQISVGLFSSVIFLLQSFEPRWPMDITYIKHAENEREMKGKENGIFL